MKQVKIPFIQPVNQKGDMNMKHYQPCHKNYFDYIVANIIKFAKRQLHSGKCYTQRITELFSRSVISFMGVLYQE